MEYKDLTEEQKAKAKEAKTPEELMALAKAEGVELTDEQIEAVSGGWSMDDCLSVCADKQGGFSRMQAARRSHVIDSHATRN